MGKSLIDLIDEELARLHKVRALLIQKGKVAESKNKNGRSGAAKKTVKRKLSPAARAKIAEAQRKRWAAVRKASK
jgi:chorismate mutase